jgi:hypothetical protein
MLVHDNQAKVELLEYGYALHRRIADRALASLSTEGDVLGELLIAQRDLADFEWALQDTGSFGEIRDLLEHGWSQYGLPRLRQRITDALRVQQELASHRSSVVITRWTTFIALVAGFVAVPPLVDVVFRPMWELLTFPRPISENAFTLLLSAVALAVVSIVLVAGYHWARAITRG